MRNRFAILLLIPSINVLAGTPTDSNLKGWDAGIIQLANSATDVQYMTDDEKKVIFYINLCRMQPKRFSSTFLKQYITKYPGMASNPYVVSLFSDLKKSKPLHPLQPDSDLYHCAENWAAQTGKSGEVGHGDFVKRLKTVLKKTYSEAAENCDYGSEEPLAIVLDLLIDDGVEGVGHRTSILAAKYNNVGVSIKPHKIYHWNCVIDFDTLY